MNEAVSSVLDPLYADGTIGATHYVQLADGSMIMWLYPKAPDPAEKWEDTKALLNVAKARRGARQGGGGEVSTR